MTLEPLKAGAGFAPPAQDQDSPAATAAGAGSGVAAQRQALSRQAQMWRKRSRQIKRLRLIFPGLIIAIAVLIFGWIVVKSVISALNVYNPATQDVRMTNPRFYGQTPSGERFEVSGLEAVRRGTATTISLKAPIMEMKGDGSRANRLESVNGVYDDSTKLFDAKGRVNFSGGASGMTLKTEQARVDISRNLVTGDGYVEGKWAGGSIQGQSFAVYDNGSRIVFHGKGDKQVTGSFNNQ
jgi:lipopolysaccharide export system protein LptC